MDNMPPIFDLFVTTLEGEGPLLKVWGQTDHKAILIIEEYLLKLSPEFDKGNYVPNIATLQLGQICFGKYNDGIYYRIKILNLNHVRDGMAIVHFVDYGNIESLPLTSIRIIESIQLTPIGRIPPLANEYILAGSLHYAENWDEKSVECVSQMICNLELKAVIVALVSHYKLIRMELKGKDLSEHLIQMGIALPITVTAQELMLNQTLHIKTREAGTTPFKRSAHHGSDSTGSRIEFKSTMLPVFSEHRVTVSAVEDGPKLFSIQLQSWEKNLSKIMTDVNSIRLIPLTEFPVPGTLCIAHCKGHNYLCRAVITQIVDLNVKVYFVDFGHSDIVDHRSVFCIPPELVTQKIIALRFSLVGLKSINLTAELKQFFKEYVKEKIFTLKVCAAEGPPLVQYCELYDKNGQNMLDLLKHVQNPQVLRYRTMKPLETDCIADVLISYVKSCREFYVHLLFNSGSLTRLMVDVATYCERAKPLSPNKIKVGTACCAYYFDDEQWYRAEVIGTDGQNFRVKYVDYGNEASVAASALKEISSDLLNRLEVQAILCCLDGFQNVPVDDAMTIEFETLALENKYTMKILKYHTNDMLLVNLTDLTHTSVSEILNSKHKKNIEKSVPAPVVNQVEKLNTEQTKPRDKRPGRSRNNEKSARIKEWNTDNQSTSQSSDSSKKSNARNSSEENKFYKKGHQDNRRKLPQEYQNKSPQNYNDFDQNRSDFRNNRKPRFSPHKKSNDVREEHTAVNFKDDPRRPQSLKRFPDKKSPNNKKWRGGLNESWSSDKSSDKSDYTGKSGRSDSSRYDKKEKQKKHGPSSQANYVQLNQPYVQLEITEGMIETVNISWFYNPKCFYCQVRSSEDKFRKMMSNLQRLYVSRPPISENIPVGSSVIATFSEDLQLYRAVVLEIVYPKYKVFYVDFGNTSFVDKKNLWKVEKQFTTLPVQAVKCTLAGIHPTGSAWNDSDEMDNCFNKGDYQCVFHGCEDDKHIVELSLNGQFITDNLIGKGLATRESVNVAIEPENNSLQLIPGIKNNLDDAPVDLDLLIGQQLIVYISFIFNLERFFIQLDKTKTKAVLNTITSYMKNEDLLNLEKLDPEQLTIGTVCLVQLDGGHFQRGIVMDTNSTNGIYVEFIDIGGGDEISKDKMFVLPFDLSNYNYQAFECTMDNFKSDANTSSIDEDFKNKYENKDVIAVVNGVENGRLFVTLYNLDGTWLDILPTSPDNKIINPLCPMPVTNAQSTVYVSAVNSINSIYIQRSQDLGAITSLLDSMYSHYEKRESSEAQCEIIVDETYAVQSEFDSNWYRGRVVNEISEEIKILFIDYGNYETIHKSSIRKLDPVFYCIPELALQISLPVLSANDQVTKKIEESIINKEFLSKLAFTDGWWYGELYENDVAISQMLIESGDAVALDFDPFKRRNAAARNSKIELFITHIDSPNEFYAQFTNDELSVKMLQEELLNEIENLPSLETPDAGVLCAAKYSADGIWYRAEVLDADEHITTVRFIDIGNTDVLDNNSSVIKTLPSRMLTIERFAKKCSLDIMPVGSEEWSQSVCEIFEQKVLGQVLPAEILYQDDKGTFYVNLYTKDGSFSETIIDEGHGTTIVRNVDEEISTKTGFVSHVESIEEFWIQFESSCPDLEMMTDLLVDAENFLELTDQRPGVLCAAKFPEDGMWYRGRILTVIDSGIEVLFIDYGNSSVSTELKILPEEVLNIRSLAMKCSLQKPDDIIDWDKTANDTFIDIAADGATVFNVKILTTGETSTVELTVNEENVVDKILSSRDTRSTIEESNIHKITISSMKSPDSFWIQFVSQKNELEDLSKQLLKVDDKFLETSTCKTEDIFGVYYSKSECWARAKLIEQVKDDYRVLLIDFGDILVVQKLKILPTEIINIPALTKHCSLILPSGVQSWPDNATKKFEMILDSCENIFDAELIDDNISPASIGLFLNGSNVLDRLLETSESIETRFETVIEKSIETVIENTSDNSLTKACTDDEDMKNSLNNEHQSRSENEKNSCESLDNKDSESMKTNDENVEKENGIDSPLDNGDTVRPETHDQNEEITVESRTEIDIENSSAIVSKELIDDILDRVTSVDGNES